MKAATKEKVKRYSLFLFGVSAHLVLVFALFVSALGLDFSKLSFS
ncbi:MAG TPA: hypothetical protein VF290_11820 [Pyrinomonadaceae bacterium]